MKKLGLIVLLLLAMNLSAGEDHRLARGLLESGRILPLEQLLEKIRPQFPGGRVLEVELEQEDDGIVYEIELLDPQGRVWELEVDAVTGEPLKREQDD